HTLTCPALGTPFLVSALCNKNLSTHTNTYTHTHTQTNTHTHTHTTYEVQVGLYRQQEDKHTHITPQKLTHTDKHKQTHTETPKVLTATVNTVSMYEPLTQCRDSFY